MGGKQEGLSGNMYKGQMDKAKGGQDRGQEVGMAGVGGNGGGKWRQLCLNNNKKNKKIRKSINKTKKPNETG